MAASRGYVYRQSGRRFYPRTTRKNLSALFRTPRVFRSNNPICLRYSHYVLFASFRLSSQHLRTADKLEAGIRNSATRCLHIHIK